MVTLEAPVIEFIGLPGAGKSTLARGVIDLLRHRGLPVEGEPVLRPAEVRFSRYERWIQRLKILSSVVAFIGGNPPYAARCVSAIVASQQPSVNDRLRMTTAWFYSSARLARVKSRARCVHVMDHGIFQSLWSVGFSGRDADGFARLSEACGAALEMPDLVVAVEVDAAIIKNRLSTRPTLSRLEKELPNNTHLLAEALGLYEALKTAVTEIAEQRLDIDLMTVTNDREDEVDTGVAAISDRVEAIWWRRQAGR